jgi:transposase
MPSFDITLNLPGFTIVKTSGFNPIIHELSCHAKVCCPHCSGTRLRKKDRILRKVWHESVGLRRVLLRFFVNKYHCRSCGRYFRQRLAGILPWQRSSEALKKQVYRQHSQGISRKGLAENFRKSDSTIARYYDHMYELENRKLRSMQLPVVLGIDEHFFSRKQRFATTFCDLKKRRIFDVAPGRSNADLTDYLEQLPGRERVRVICMDLSETYRSIARNFFPGALVVADRFHVVRLALYHLLKTCRTIDPQLKGARGLARLLQKHAKNLTDRQRQRLKSYLAGQPAIAQIYRFKEELMVLLSKKKQTKGQCRELVHELLAAIKMLQDSGFEDCVKLGKTLESWQIEIGRMWRFSRSNGITEGFHRKMKLIQRRAFGFRNFENYRRRVRALCA